MKLKELEQDGILLHIDETNRMPNLAILSLRIALKSFFSTYSAMKNNFNIRKSKSEEDYIYSLEYYEEYSKTIVYFHHFFELVIKDILRNEEELLTIDFVKDPIILYKLLKKEEINHEDYKHIFTIEFSKALSILKELIKAKLITNHDRLGFLAKQDIIDVLNMLNKLRNRVVHRGSFILKYKSLDIYIGKYIFPITKAILELDEYKELQKGWKYKKNEINIDSIDEIIKTFDKEVYNFDRLAYLKEIGKASYDNPITPHKPKDRGIGTWYEHLNNIIIQRAEEIAKLERNSQNVSKVVKCIVCGLETLVIYEDEDCDYDIVDGKQIMSAAWRFTYEAKCFCCNFEVERTLKNPKQCGIDIEDFWYGEDLMEK